MFKSILGMLPSDVIFVLETKPHIRFQREGDDLVYDCPIDLKDAVCGVRTSVLTLDNRCVLFTIML
jgi:DnaJ-class molecular chaperone